MARTKQPASLLESLLGSRVRAVLLGKFMTRPREQLYARQLSRETGLGLYSIQTELARWERLGIVTAKRVGKEKLYQVNHGHYLYPELQRIVYKTVALGDALREVLANVKGIECAFIYGSVAKGSEKETSDIDLFILGRPDHPRLSSVLSDVENRVGREVSVVTMAPDEWQRRRQAGEGFVLDLIGSPKVFLIGDERTFRRI